jgi:hypothetical protein
MANMLKLEIEKIKFAKKIPSIWRIISQVNSSEIKIHYYHIMEKIKGK